MDLYERFKVDVLGTSKGRISTDVLLGRFEDVHMTFLQNFKNKQQLLRLSSNIFGEYDRKYTTVMCIVLCLKFKSWERPKNVTMQTSL